jgi:hypothetical protein
MGKKNGLMIHNNPKDEFRWFSFAALGGNRPQR